MKTEITLDEQALAELLKDPEVKVKIHDAVVADVVKRVAESTDKAVEEKLRDHLDGMVMAVLRSDCGQMFYPKPGAPGCAQLASKARDEIRKVVNAAFMEQARQMVYDRLNSLEDALKKQVDETWKLLMNQDRISVVVTSHIEKLIEDGLKQALGNRPPQ